MLSRSGLGEGYLLLTNQLISPLPAHWPHLLLLITKKKFYFTVKSENTKTTSSRANFTCSLRPPVCLLLNIPTSEIQRLCSFITLFIYFWLNSTGNLPVWFCRFSASFHLWKSSSLAKANFAEALGLEISPVNKLIKRSPLWKLPLLSRSLQSQTNFRNSSPKVHLKNRRQICSVWYNVMSRNHFTSLFLA